MEKVEAALSKLSKASMIPERSSEPKKVARWREDLKGGDHIAVWYAPLGGKFDIGYFHHGIYIGGHTVAHYPRDGNGPCLIDIWDFLDGHTKYFIVRYDKEDSDDHRALTIWVARYITETPRSIGKYDFFYINCESFATGCKTGTGTTAQIDNLKAALPVLADGIAQMAAASSNSCIIS